MSSQTPNLNLVLPVGTEKVSRQIINDNNTKIDTAVGSNSQAIANITTSIKREVLTSATNFNGLRVLEDNPNAYYCGSNLGLHSGIPSGSYSNVPFTLDVVSMGSYSVQTLNVYASSGGPRTFRRQTYYSGGETPYNSWSELATKSEFAITNRVGWLLNSGSDVIAASGTAMIALYPNNLAIINIECRINTKGTSATYSYGINRDAISATCGKTITPVEGGTAQYFNADGTLDTTSYGDGGTWAKNGNFWTPARNYNGTNTGGWDSTHFNVGQRISGVLYGTWA